MASAEIKKADVRKAFFERAKEVGLKQSDLPYPKVDRTYINLVFVNLRIYCVYVIYLCGCYNLASGLPEIYIGMTRMSILKRVYIFISSKRNNARYGDLYFKARNKVIYGGLTHNEARLMEMRVIKAVRESKILFPLNESKGADIGSTDATEIFIKAVIEEYIDNIRTDITSYRLYGPNFDTTRVSVPHGVLDVSVKEILKNPRYLKDIHWCIDEVARKWENISKEDASGRSKEDPRCEISNIMDFLQRSPC